ncbi:MAG: hypothetical protein IPJ88_11950 [Myxococcales bacterium]|nr:MAG: hypothetical protein IPJ88_11950 [Myxococcales bacterium]
MGLFYLFCTSSTVAQDQNKWLVMRSLPGGPEGRSHAAAEALAQALLELRQPAMSLDGARTLFEARASSESNPIQEADLKELKRDTEKALSQVVDGNYGRARQTVEHLLKQAQRVLESVSSDESSARALLNACLYLVRSDIEEGHDREALDAARRCRQLVPHISPDSYDHPPEVIDMVSSVDAEIAAAPKGSLSITADANQCPIWISGNRVGQTPLKDYPLIPREYRIKVECPMRKTVRVHRIVVGAQATELHIDTRFDEIVRTDPDLHLSYDNVEREQNERLSHAHLVAEVLSANEVWLITPVDSQRLRADRIRSDDAEVLASVVFIPQSNQAYELLPQASKIAETLIREQSLDLSTATASTIEPWNSSGEFKPETLGPPGSEDTSTQGSGPGIVGFALGLTGIAASITGAALLPNVFAKAKLVRAAESTDPDYLDRQQAANDAMLFPMLSSAVGASLITAALPFWLPDARGVPTLAWLAGGAGVALAGAGSAIALFAGSCEQKVCAGRNDMLALGSTLAMHALPLLSIPVIYLLRSLTDNKTQDLKLSADSTQARIQWTVNW